MRKRHFATIRKGHRIKNAKSFFYNYSSGFTCFLIHAQWILAGRGCRQLFHITKTFGYPLALAVVLGLHATAASIFAGGFDGSQPLLGATGKVIEINQYKIVEHVDADTVGLPKKFIIDFKNKLLRPSKDSVIRKTIVFKRIEHIENTITLQGIDTGVDGVDDGLAWSLTISKKDGKAVLAASGDGIAYVVFGTCSPQQE